MRRYVKTQNLYLYPCRYLCFLALLVILPSCSVWNNLIVPPEERYKLHIQNHEYLDAINLAQLRQEKAFMEENEQQGDSQLSDLWSARKDEALEKAMAFQQQEFKAIDTLREEENWHEARFRARFLVENLPDNPSLQAYLEKFEKARQAYIVTTENALLVLGSQAVPVSIQLYKKLDAAGDQDKQVKKQLKHLLQKRVEILEALTAQLEEAEANKNIDDALVYARSIQRIDDSEANLEKISALRAELKGKNVLLSERREVTQQQRQQQLNDYGKAVVEKRWVDARALLNEMLKSQPDDGELQGQDTYLKEVFQSEVAKAREKGEQLYAEGRIEEALTVWQSVVKMAPNDLQLAANIQRAQRILAKVQELKSTNPENLPELPITGQSD